MLLISLLCVKIILSFQQFAEKVPLCAYLPLIRVLLSLKPTLELCILNLVDLALFVDTIRVHSNSAKEANQLILLKLFIETFDL